MIFTVVRVALLLPMSPIYRYSEVLAMSSTSRTGVPIETVATWAPDFPIAKMSVMGPSLCTQSTPGFCRPTVAPIVRLGYRLQIFRAIEPGNSWE